MKVKSVFEIRFKYCYCRVYEEMNQERRHHSSDHLSFDVLRNSRAPTAEKL